MAGTRSALSEAGRKSLTITLPWVDAQTVGALIALFERAISIYASLVDINAYHQPVVEDGKVVAGKLIALQKELGAALLERRSFDQHPFPASDHAGQR